MTIHFLSPSLSGFAAILLSLTAPLQAEVLVQSAQTIAFLGDSITQQGASNSTGYVRLVEAGLKANGVQVKILGAGVGGHKSNQMLWHDSRKVDV